MVTLHWHFHKETNVWSEHLPHFHIYPCAPIRDKVNWLPALSLPPPPGSAYFSWKICPLRCKVRTGSCSRHNVKQDCWPIFFLRFDNPLPLWHDIYALTHFEMAFFNLISKLFTMHLKINIITKEVTQCEILALFLKRFLQNKFSNDLSILLFWVAYSLFFILLPSFFPLFLMLFIFL